MKWKVVLGLIGFVIGAIGGYIQFEEIGGLIGIGIVGYIFGALIGMIIDKNK